MNSDGTARNGSPAREVWGAPLLQADDVERDHDDHEKRDDARARRVSLSLRAAESFAEAVLRAGTRERFSGQRRV
jgi:hypothetical protein